MTARRTVTCPFRLPTRISAVWPRLERCGRTHGASSTDEVSAPVAPSSRTLWEDTHGASSHVADRGCCGQRRILDLLGICLAAAGGEVCPCSRRSRRRATALPRWKAFPPTVARTRTTMSWPDPVQRDAHRAGASGDALPDALGDRDGDARGAGPGVAGDLQRDVHRGPARDQTRRRLDLDVEEQPSGEERDRGTGRGEQREHAAGEDRHHSDGEPSSQSGSHQTPFLERYGTVSGHRRRGAPEGSRRPAAAR